MRKTGTLIHGISTRTASQRINQWSKCIQGAASWHYLLKALGLVNYNNLTDPFGSRFNCCFQMIKPILQITEHVSSHKTKSILRGRSESVNQFGETLDRTIRDLVDTIKGHEIAVGLSAVQIGILARCFVVDTAKICEIMGGGQNLGMLAMVNPEILNLSAAREKQAEACMSLPHFQGEVERSTKVRVKYQTVLGIAKQLTAEGFLARVIQHEVDHLDGILYMDRMAAGDELIPVEEISVIES